MPRLLPSLAAGFALLTVCTTPSVAHHSFSMYDMAKTVTLQGEVRRFVWANPHSHIVIAVAPGGAVGGPAGEFDAEGPAPNILVRQGWNKLTLKTGDRVTVVVHPMRTNDKAGALVSAIVNGVTMYPDAQRPTPEPAGATKKAAGQ